MRITTRAPASAFTLVELLVVIAIIGVLVAMAVPALSACREAMRRMECSANAARLAQAMHQYEAASLRFPAGCWNEVSPVPNTAEGRQQGWLITLLPYLDRNDAYRAFHAEESVFAPANEELRGVSIATLHCPSDASGKGLPFPAASYAGVYHDAETPIAEKSLGAMVLNQPLRVEDFADGLANTLLLGEKQSTRQDLGWLSGGRSTLRNTGHLLNEPPASADAVGGFAGPHTGGVVMAMTDGQVRFLSSDIAAPVLAALGNREDGKLISDQEY